MKNKYYTPDISEFHVGFEYEMECLYETDTFPKYEWAEATVEIDEDLKELNRLLNSNEIRVKYLDKEDIEELGWEYHELNNQYYSDELRSYSLIYNTSSKFTRIEEWEDGIGGVLFEGYLKNKSELKQIMRMVKITME